MNGRRYCTLLFEMLNGGYSIILVFKGYMSSISFMFFELNLIFKVITMCIHNNIVPLLSNNIFIPKFRKFWLAFYSIYYIHIIFVFPFDLVYKIILYCKLEYLLSI